MKESYPEIHNANEIGTEHIQAFLNFKTRNCSQATLNQYSALFRKLVSTLAERHMRHENIKSIVKTVLLRNLYQKFL